MTNLVITRGLPGAGKTTYAMEWLTWGARRARVNRDDIRENIMGANLNQQGVLDYATECVITTVQHAAVTGLIKAGYDVVVDDTNLKLAHARAWADLAHELGAEFECVDFLDVPLATCITRAEWRTMDGGRRVNADVIRKLHERYGLSRGLPPVVRTQVEPFVPLAIRQYQPQDHGPSTYIFDIDGTLALMGDRSPYAWDKVSGDKPNAWVVTMAQSLYAAGFSIVCLSGRDGSCYEDTRQWLDDNYIPCDALFMRKAGDTRKDSIVKAEIFWECVYPTYAVIAVVDDRQQVVDMWRAMGIPVAQVAPGAF